MKPELKKISTEEIPVIAGLANEIWHQYYSEFIKEEQIRYMLDKFYSTESLTKQINEGQEFFLIYSDNEIAGFVTYSEKEENSFFIHKFYIRLSYHGKQIGTEIIKHLYSEFSKKAGENKFELRLTVNRQNYKAINFYFRNGFRIEKTEDFDIGEGYFMNDFVMFYSPN